MLVCLCVDGSVFLTPTYLTCISVSREHRLIPFLVLPIALFNSMSHTSQDLCKSPTQRRFYDGYKQKKLTIYPNQTQPTCNKPKASAPNWRPKPPSSLKPAPSSAAPSSATTAKPLAAAPPSWSPPSRAPPSSPSGSSLHPGARSPPARSCSNSASRAPGESSLSILTNLLPRSSGPPSLASLTRLGI